MSENNKRLTELIDVNYLQQLQDAFSDATGLAAITTDLEGDVTKPSNFNEFCIKYTRGTRLGLERCNKCDLEGGKETLTTGNPAVYHCHAGLIDFSVPIMYEGRQIGTMVGGQALYQKPDEAKFRKVAQEIGVNPDEYIAALRKVPIIPEHRIRAAADLMSKIVGKLTSTLGNTSDMEFALLDVNKSAEGVKTAVSKFYKTSDELNNGQTDLMTEIQNINGLLKEINNIVKSVSSIADETQMISFNASIEAARAGEHGRSFTVIAGEIRRLSEQSKKTVSNIQSFTANIQKSITKTTEYSKTCMDAIESEVQDLDDIKHNIDIIKEKLAPFSRP